MSFGSGGVLFLKTNISENKKKLSFNMGNLTNNSHSHNLHEWKYHQTIYWQVLGPPSQMLICYTTPASSTPVLK